MHLWRLPAFSNLHNAWLIGLHFPSLQSLISTTIFFSSFSSFPSRSFRRHACSSTALRLISKTVRLHWTWTSTTCLNRRTCPFWTTFTSGICLCADGLCSSNGIDLNKVNVLLRDQPDLQDNPLNVDARLSLRMRLWLRVRHKVADGSFWVIFVANQYRSKDLSMRCIYILDDVVQEIFITTCRSSSTRLLHRFATRS